MRAIFALAAAAAVALTIGVAARADPQAGARYELKPVAGGFLRLDRETGTTAMCESSGEGYACRPTEEGRSADAAMIAQLEKRVATLEARLAASEADRAALKAAPPRDPTLDLPTDAQVDRVAGFLERTLRRFRKLAEDVQREGGSL